MNHSYLVPLVSACRAHRESDTARQMKAYMKNQFEFLGIKTPLRKTLFGDFIKVYGLPDIGNLEAMVDELWNLPEREFQYLAISLTDRFRKKFRREDIAWIRKMIVGKSWWDTVDGVAAWFAGDYFRTYPEEIPLVTRAWMDSQNRWLQRSALLFQLSYKQHTDTTLLFDYINELKDSGDFFIRKAIGWTLREYSKTNPQAVSRFVSITPLASLSRKEALKVIGRTHHLS